MTFGWGPKILRFDILIGKHQWRPQSLTHPVGMILVATKESFSTMDTFWDSLGSIIEIFDGSFINIII